MALVEFRNKVSEKYASALYNDGIHFNFRNSLFIFIVMLMLHIVFNYFAVRAVCLRTLNEPRFIQVIDTYLKKEIVPSPCEINRNEPIIFYQLGPMLLGMYILHFNFF